MKISEVIEGLEKIQREYGDIDCWYSKDDEGNGYFSVWSAATVGYINAYEEFVHPDDAEDYEKELIPVCVVN